MNDERTVSLPGLPRMLEWALPPIAWGLTDTHGLTCSAGPQTDLFVDPGGAAPVLNAPRLLMPTSGDFIFQASVSVDFRTTFDAGVLLLYSEERLWAKLCFELSPQQQPMVVSVVTREHSDDANAFEVGRGEVSLRVARLGPAFAFHASTGGSAWKLIRHFALTPRDPIMVGFLAQSPTGNGCTVQFEDIHFASERLADLRSGV